VVLGISADTKESHQKFAKKYKLPYTLLCDPERKVMTEYGAYGKKKMYGITMTGTIRSSVWIGPDGVVKKRWAKVSDAAKHPAQVLEAISKSQEAR
jgi:peroxiredoxin Q/BCP